MIVYQASRSASDGSGCVHTKLGICPYLSVHEEVSSSELSIQLNDSHHALEPCTRRTDQLGQVDYNSEWITENKIRMH